MQRLFKKKDYRRIANFPDDNVSTSTPSGENYTPQDILKDIFSEDSAFTQADPATWFRPEDFTDGELKELLELALQKGRLQLIELCLSKQLSEQRSRLKKQLREINFRPYEDNKFYHNKYNILQLAIVSNCPRLVRFLVNKKKHSVLPSQNNNMNLFILAAESGCLTTMKLLSSKQKGNNLSHFLQSNLYYTDPAGNPLLLIFAKHGYLDCFKWVLNNSGYALGKRKNLHRLYESRSTVVFNRKTGDTLLQTAFLYQQAVFVEYLFKFKPLVWDARNKKTGDYMIHFFLKQNNLFMVKQLIDMKCSLFRNSEGDNPVHLAARLNFFAAFIYIFGHGKPDLNLLTSKNGHDETILEIAASLNHQEVVRFVLEHTRMPMDPALNSNELEHLVKSADKYAENKPGIARNYLSRAIELQMQNLVEDSSPEQILQLARLQNKMGCRESRLKRNAWFEKAHDTMSQLTPQKAGEWRMLSHIQYNIAIHLPIKGEERKAWMRKAYQSLLSIPQSALTEKDRKDLSDLAKMVGVSSLVQSGAGSAAASASSITESTTEISSKESSVETELSESSESSSEMTPSSAYNHEWQKILEENEQLKNELIQLRGAMQSGLTTFVPIANQAVTIAVDDSPVVSAAPVLRT